MKNIIPSVLMIFIVAFSPVILSGQWVYGGGMKFNSNSEFSALGINAKVGKDIAEKLDLNVDIAYYIASRATFSLDFDLHYRLFNISDKISINPFAGINFTNTSITNNSLSLGMSFRVPDQKYTYYMEPRWILDNKQFVFSIGVLL
jgi:hypothetical protein